MAIGKPRRIAGPGRKVKRRGSIGKPTTFYGSAQTVDQDRIKIKYPTTTTP